MFGLFRNRAQDALTARLYAGLNEAARRPALYLDHGVPDTVEGRYDMMVLHLFVLVQRLRAGSPRAQDVAQAVCDRFFTEMDRAMREMGVGDLAVPKKMTKIAELYAGCAKAYAAALEGQDGAALAAALLRNVYEGKAGMTAQAQTLAAYVRAAVAALAAAPEAGLIEGRLPFPEPATFVGTVA